MSIWTSIKNYFGFGGHHVPTGIVSPYPSASLYNIAWSEHFAGEQLEISRESAMMVPAIARARQIIITVIANLPLREFDDQGNEVDQPWLYRSESGVSPWHLKAWILDDLIFYGWSLLAVKRDSSDQIIDVQRVPRELWDYDPYQDEIRINNQPASRRDIILIPGPFEGLLAAGASTIKGARAIERAWIGRAQNPIPLIELHQISDDHMTQKEVKTLIDDWAGARTAPNGAVGFTDNRVELRVHGQVETDLFVQGRNQVVLDVARLLGIPGALLDGSMSTASLTYSTGETKRNEFLDFSLAYWTAPIEGRLSLDDVCTPGNKIRFDHVDLVSTENPPINHQIKD